MIVSIRNVAVFLLMLSHNALFPPESWLKCNLNCSCLRASLSIILNGARGSLLWGCLTAEHQLISLLVHCSQILHLSHLPDHVHYQQTTSKGDSIQKRRANNQLAFLFYSAKTSTSYCYHLLQWNNTATQQNGTYCCCCNSFAHIKYISVDVY